MAVFIDIPGIGTVEAKGAASEATLRELVKVMGGKPTGGGGDRKDDGGGGAGPTSVVGKALFGLGKAAGVTVGVLGKMTGGVIKATASAVGLSESAIGAADALSRLDGSASGVASIFQGIPLFGAAFKAVAGAADDVVKSYTAVSQSGATFGGSISNFSRAASEAGMTMAEFGNLVKANGQGMLGFGSTTEDGAKRFSQVSKALRTTGSDLYALGFSTQEINQGLANYGALLRQQGLQGSKSNAELAKGAKNYLKEMDALAKITGEERSAKEQQAKALAADAQFQASMAGMNEQVRSSFRDTVLGLPGPLQNFTKDMLANGVATTEENQKLMAMMPQSAAMLQRLNAKMQRGEQVTMEERNALNNMMKREGATNLKNIKQAGAASAELSGMVNGLAATQQINIDGVKEATEAQKQATANSDRFNEKMQAMQQRIAEVSNNFKGLLANSGILDVLINAFEFVANVATQYLVPAFNIIASAVMKVGNGISLVLSPVIDYLGEKFGAKGLGGTVEWIDGMMNTVFDAVGGAVRGVILAFDGLWDGVMTLIDPFKGLMHAVFGTGEGVGSFGDILIDVGAFVGDALRFFGTVIGGVITVLTPIIKAVVDVFKFLWNTTKTVINFFGNLGDYLTEFGAGLSALIDGILVAIPNAMGGISKEEKQKRDEARALAKETRDAERKSREDSKVKDVEQHKAELANDKKHFAEKKVTSDKVTAQAKKEADAKEAAIKAQEKKNQLDYNAGPEELVKQFAKQENSKLLPNEAVPKTATKEVVKEAETAKKEIERKGEEKTAADKKAADEAEAKRKAEEKVNEEKGKGTPPTQESAETLLAQLNTNMAQLVKLSKEQKDIGERQLGVTRSLSKDLFAAV